MHLLLSVNYKSESAVAIHWIQSWGPRAWAPNLLIGDLCPTPNWSAAYDRVYLKKKLKCTYRINLCVNKQRFFRLSKQL